MHPRLVRHVTGPLLQRWAGSRIGAVLRELERTQWFPPEQLRELQWVRLRALLRHASTTVPYYQRLFQELGVRAEDFRGLEDLPRLPVLTKAVVRERAAELRSQVAGPLFRRVTSGSTGIPLQTYVDARARDAMGAAARRANRWWGREVGDRHVLLTTAVSSRRRRLRAALLNQTFLSSADLSEEALLRLWRRLQRVRPASLRGNPHVLSRLAEVLAEHGGAGSLRLRAIVCTAEMLYHHQHSRLVETFGCPVIDHYGANEVGLIAAACPAGRMHISAENVLVETAPPAADGAPWPELIVTDLTNWGMPLIRYAVGDLGAPAAAPCPCGRPLPLLTLRAGRTGDFIVLRGNRYLEHSVLCSVFEEIGGDRVHQYRIIQESRDRFTVLIAGKPAEEVAEAVRRGFRRKLASPVGVDVRFVEHIPLERSGKLRLFLTRVGAAAGPRGLSPSAVSEDPAADGRRSGRRLG